MRYWGFKLFIGACVLLIGGITILVGGIKDKVNLNKPRMNFSELTAEDLRDGMFVEGTVYEMWDNFAYETNDSTTREYYAMPLETSFELDEPVFVAVKVVTSQDKATASKMSKETDDYYIRDIEPAVWTEMQLTGKVKKLKGDILDYFEEYVEEMGYSPAVSMKPYVIVRYTAGHDRLMLTVGIVMAAVGLVMLGLYVFFGIIKRRR